MPLLVNSDPSPEYAAPIKPVQKQIRQKTGLFSKANLKETIEILPKLPDTESVSEMRQFLISNLHFSAQQTRHRYANYIISRMFPTGIVDRALRVFANKYSGMKELREVCFYRFCKAEPLMLDVLSEILIPAIGIGKISRQRISNYLNERFPESKSIGDCSQAIVDALNAGGIVRADRTHISFSYREIPTASLAFIIHSEFTEPGMHGLAKLEENSHIKAMLLNPTNLVQMLYELRNLGLISKISEIDNIRQFTTKWELRELVDRITS
jgi:DNA repair protein RadC